MNIFPAVQIQGRPGRRGIDVSTRYGDEFQDALTHHAEKHGGFCQVIIKAPTSPATAAQNNFFHALLGVYYKSGIHSYVSYDDMRETIKTRYGVVKDIQIEGEEYRIIASWAKYNKGQRTRCIEGLISEMEQSGILDSACSAEYLEIINGVKDA